MQTQSGGWKPIANARSLMAQDYCAEFLSEGVMRAEHIDPFVSSTMNVLKTMAMVNPEKEAPFVKKDKLTWGVVTGVIGMAGDEVKGNMVVSFDEPSILEIVGNMLGEKFESLTSDVVDAVGEITNMISGGAKAQLSEMGFKFEMATPLMIKGQNVEITQYQGPPVIVIPFKTATGKFVVEANLAPVKAR